MTRLVEQSNFQKFATVFKNTNVFAGKAYIDPSNVLLDGSMQWWPLEVNSDQKLYQDYPPRLTKKSNQGIQPYFSFTLASLNFQSLKLASGIFQSFKQNRACLSIFSFL